MRCQSAQIGLAPGKCRQLLGVCGPRGAV
jgi:hypothetical protein